MYYQHSHGCKELLFAIAHILATYPHILATYPHILATYPHILATYPHILATYPHILATYPHILATYPHILATYPVSHIHFQSCDGHTPVTATARVIMTLLQGLLNVTSGLQDQT